MDNNKFYLNVPYSEKEKAKELGARWDANAKKWYIIVNNEKFTENLQTIMHNSPKWYPSLDNFILYSPAYIAGAVDRCWECRDYSRVYALASHKIQVKRPSDIDRWEDALNYEADARIYVPDGLFLAREIIGLDDSTSEYLKKQIPQYFKDYSNTLKKRYYMNHCEHCNAKLGEHYLYNDAEAVFTPNTKKQYLDMVFKEIPHEKVIISNCKIHEFWLYQSAF